MTANHVLSDISSENATLNLRLTNATGAYTNFQFPVPIRNAGKPIWCRHPKADVAAMVVSLPAEFMKSHSWLDDRLIYGDADCNKWDIQPGDEVMCLGYPLRVDSGIGNFPLLRSARIASYPVYPSSVAETFRLDMPVYPGNSGGPVFFDFRNRTLPGVKNVNFDLVGVIGMVQSEISATSNIDNAFEVSIRKNPLGIAVVTPAQFIRETLNLLVHDLTNKPSVKK